MGGVNNGGAGALNVYPDEDRHELRTPEGQGQKSGSFLHFLELRNFVL